MLGGACSCCRLGADVSEACLRETQGWDGVPGLARRNVGRETAFVKLCNLHDVLGRLDMAGYIIVEELKLTES